MQNFGGPGQYMSEDEYIMHVGRKATGSGLIGFGIGFIFSLFMNFSLVGIVFFSLLSGYLFLTGFWGGYNVNRWFRKFRHRLPKYIWVSGKVPVITIGVIAGWMVWGFFEHFILLLAMGASGNPGMILAQILLIPKLGSKVADKINYHPSQVTMPEQTEN